MVVLDFWPFVWEASRLGWWFVVGRDRSEISRVVG